MQSLLLLTTDASSFEPDELEQAFRANSGFRNLRFDKPGGDLIACKYEDSDSWALLDVSKDRDCISITDSGNAALQAVLIIQRALGIPLQMINSTYTFDLTFSDIATVEELEAAMDNARTS